MAPEQKGVLVRVVSPISLATNPLRPNDIILRFDGVQVASDGTVPFRWGSHPSVGLCFLL
jgi:S1-C subfamily serine protease